jgi:MFS transporter, NNP family, nitrate/nitrite transporter
MTAAIMIAGASRATSFHPWANEGPIRQRAALRDAMAKGFFKSGHLPSLASAFLYFDASFMVWVLLGPLGVQIARDLHLNAAQQGLMVATPILIGAVLRLPLGVFADHAGPRSAGIVAQVLVIAGLVTAWLLGVHSFSTILLVGIVLGLAGASFAVALPLASQWYPPEYQGVALGIAGAGNSGTVFAALLAPSLAILFGWRNVLGLAAVPLLLVLAFFILNARNSPHAAPRKSWPDYLKVLRIVDCWWFMFFYSVTFGGFVGLSSSLTIYFNDQYGLSPVIAGYCTAACVFAGSLMRPIGGAVADRIGGIRALTFVYVVAAACFAAVSINLPQAWMALAAFIAGMLALGVGNGSVFQLVPQRFRREIGVMTGIVGFAGGIGGFVLASSLGYAKHFTGSYQFGFLLFALLAALALAGLAAIKRRWRATWGAATAVGTARV